MPNGTEPKEKKKKGKKKHDAPREHDGEATPPRDETNHEAPKVKRPFEGHKRSGTRGDDTQLRTQYATDGIPETSGETVKKRKKEEKGEKARLKQGDVSKETKEPVAASVDDGTKDEKKVKKRKHKEKKEDDAETNHGSTARTLKPLASQTDDAKGENNKKKGKGEKADGKKRKQHEDSIVGDVEQKRKKKQRKQEE